MNKTERIERIRVGRKAGMIGIAVNLLLFALKITAGILSGSVAITADAINNLTDAGSSVLVMVGCAISAKPADREHPYGHARMEYLCGLFISVIVTVLGIELLRSSVFSLFSAEPAVYSVLSVVVMAASMAVKIVLGVYYRFVAKKTDSDALKASAADCIGDVCATAAVLLGIILTPVFGPKTDGIFGLLLAIYIVVMGVKLVWNLSDKLLGAAPDPELIQKIVGKIRSYDGVLGMHDLVLHNYGVGRYFASVHVEMDAARDVLESHDVIDNMEADFLNEMGLNLIVHYDPIAVNDARTDELHTAVRGIVEEIASELSSPISTHDFRAVFGVSHTNVLFDLAVPDEFPMTNAELVQRIRSDALQTLGEQYHFIINVDRGYMTTRY